MNFLAVTLRSLWRNRIGAVSLVVVLAYIAVAVSVEVYAGVCKYRGIEPVYYTAHEAERFSPPSAKYWLGTGAQPSDTVGGLLKKSRVL